jgi:hypothetical protein
MKASELRIGNYVYFHGDVEEINIDHFNIFNIKKDGALLPIPLTEEWLLRFGFEKNGNNQFILMEGSVDILFNKDLNGWTCDGINFSINMTEHVHQLQNLYFALTGEELNFKSE